MEYYNRGADRPSLVEAAKGTASFEEYRNGVLYYRLTWVGEDEMFDKFIIPIQIQDRDDTGGSFLPR